MNRMEQRYRLRALIFTNVLLGATACAPSVVTPGGPKMATTSSLAAASTSAARYNEAPNQYVTVEGARLAYRTMGVDTAEPPLVFMQHFTGTMDDWDPEVVEGLASGRRVYVFDSAGVGASAGVTPGSIQGMARVAEAFVDALQLKTVDLLGFSMGGAVAQQVLIERPALVRRAVLAGTAAKGTRAENLPAVVDDAFKRAATQRSHPKVFLFFTETEAGKAAAAQFVGRINKHTVDPDPPATQATAQAHLKAIMAWSRAEANDAELAAIEQPVLIVNGSNDIMAPTPASYAMYQHMPHAQLVLYPDSGHGALFQYHQAFVNEVDSFLRSAP